jgi:serine phosphatase RsbU (regulator of sigma subunit)/anti-sigma regulatory factor (Ser/Thr protein kinase)/anti-anti-sigma regulatory factor
VSSGERDMAAPDGVETGFGLDPGLIASWFDDIPAALWMVAGPDHRVMGMNRAARASVGGRAAVPGSPARELGSDFLDDAMLARMDEVFASGIPMVDRARSVVDRDASGDPVELVVNVSIVPTTGSDGQVRGLMVERLDITQAALNRRRVAQQVADLGRRLDNSRAVVSTMQEVLLPGVLPLLPGLRLAARYLFSAGQATGGDWFDAVPLSGGRVALVVGDVVGHGASASAVMGQLRAVLMAYLLDGIGIGDAVARLDRFADRLPGGRGATIAVGVLDRAAGRWSYVCCAHPPPIVVGPGGATRVLPMVSGPPLGSGGSRRPTVKVVTLRPGDTVVLYSDGLVESPGAPISDGIERLSRALSTVGPRTGVVPAPDLLSQIALEVIDPDLDDDVTVLAVQLSDAGPPEQLEMDVPADPAVVARVRERIRQWLGLLGTAVDDQAAIMLAATEAVSNAIEHAYPAGAGQDGGTATVRVEAVLDASGRACLTVSDHGRWRAAPVEPGHRGRGLRLLRSLMDSVEIERDDQGTAVLMERQLGFPVVLGDERTPELRAVDRADELLVEITRGEHPLLTVRGPVDISTVTAFAHALADVSRGGALPFTVDLSAVTILSSVGVQALADLLDTDPLGNVPTVVAPSGTLVREVLALTDLDERMPVLERLSMTGHHREPGGHPLA